MKCPFPGMDPYLERHWGDVHSDLIAQTRTTLNGELPPDLIARTEERVARFRSATACRSFRFRCGPATRSSRSISRA
jgi:hypothetical protein